MSLLAIASMWSQSPRRPAVSYFRFLVSVTRDAIEGLCCGSMFCMGCSCRQLNVLLDADPRLCLSVGQSSLAQSAGS